MSELGRTKTTGFYMAKKKTSIGFLAEPADEHAEETPTQDVLLINAICKLANNYRRVEHFNDCTDFITTHDIYNQLQEFYPAKGLFGYNEAAVTKALENYGWQFDYHPKLNSFYWLVKKVGD